MIKEQVQVIPFWHRVELPANVTMLPPNAGHILGAMSSFFVQDLGIGKKCSVFHSSDFLFDNQNLIPGAPKRFLPNTEIGTIVSEATNIGSPAVNRKVEIQRFIDAVNEVLRNGGRVVIPVFKIHRAQEIWEILLSHGIPISKVFVDGNASELFGIYQKYTSIRYLPKSQIIRNEMFDRWKRWNSGDPCVILAFGGMVQERSAAWHNTRMVIENERDAFFAVGYMDPCAPGGELLDAITKEKKEIDIGLERFEIKCRVERFALSGHEGNDGLLYLAARARDRVIFTHGDGKRVREHLKNAPRHHFHGVNGKEFLL